MKRKTRDDDDNDDDGPGSIGVKQAMGGFEIMPAIADDEFNVGQSNADINSKTKSGKKKGCDNNGGDEALGPEELKKRDLIRRGMGKALSVRFVICHQYTFIANHL